MPSYGGTLSAEEIQDDDDEHGRDSDHGTSQALN